MMRFLKTAFDEVFLVVALIALMGYFYVIDRLKHRRYCRAQARGIVDLDDYRKTRRVK